jgi:hypothetical protein
MRKTRNAQDTVCAPGPSKVSRRVKACAGLGMAALVGAMTVAPAVPAVSAASPGTPSQPAITVTVSPVSPAGPTPVPLPTPSQTGKAAQTGCCA